MVVSNYSSYNDPEQVSLMKDSLYTALEQQQKVYGTEETAGVYASFKEDISTYLTEYRFKRSSMFKLIGAFIALFGTVLLGRRKKIGAHLFVGGMLFSIIGTFYFHSFGLTGWALAMMPILFTLAVGVLIYRKRASLS